MEKVDDFAVEGQSGFNGFDDDNNHIHNIEHVESLEPNKTRTATNINNVGSKRYYHDQLGAPALIYQARRGGSGTLWNTYRIPFSQMPMDSSKDLQQRWTYRNRVAARWEYGLDVDQVEHVKVSSRAWKRDVNRKQSNNPENNPGEDAMSEIEPNHGNGDNDNEFDDNRNADKFSSEKRKNRFVMLLQEDPTRLNYHLELLHTSITYEHPYFPGNMNCQECDRRTGSGKEPHLRPGDFAKGQEFRIQREIFSDPSYLAPFDIDALKEVTDETVQSYRNFRKRIQGDDPPRLSQGNTLVACRCPCGPCSQLQQGPQQSSNWILIHPKGHLLERLCVSNIIPPMGRINGGHISNVKNDIKYYGTWEVYQQLPNEVDLDDTILEVKQCGVWTRDKHENDTQHPSSCLVLTVRTGTHVSVVNVKCHRPECDRLGYQFAADVCWGCYVLKETERLDFRSITPRLPSFQPVSLTSHPRYGNDFAPSKFAFACHSVRELATITRNVVYNCQTFRGESVICHRHDITNLRKIALLDYTTTNPMCLWSAASSYVRPALAMGVVAKLTRQTKVSYGLGTSLYTIDLRSNTATFQWSPSAKEMTTEGVHSLSGLMTDWNRDSFVWVSSISAGKTWEVDGRMPAKAVNCWSLTSSCEGSRHIVVPSTGFHGESSLLVSTLDASSSINDHGGSPFVKVDTDYGATGIHVYQRPLRRPRFQTDSLEAIAVPGVEPNQYSSIATSSYYALPDVQSDCYICGISSLRLSVDQFITEDDNTWSGMLKRDTSIVCNLTINNDGDIFCHSLLENSRATSKDSALRFNDLPVGTKVISIPPELDGRTINLQTGHQKPTGGMNLKLFLTNQYPLPRRSVAVETGSKGIQNEFLVSETKRKKGIDHGDFVEIKKKFRPPGLRLQPLNGNHEMLQKEIALTIPASISQQAVTPISIYNRRNRESSSENSLNSMEEAQGKSDLPPSAIRETLELWDQAMSGDEHGDNVDWVDPKV